MIRDIVRGRSALRVVFAAVVALAALLLAGPATASAAVPTAAPAAVTAPTAPAATAAMRTVALSSLPPEATDTYNLIRKGGPYPYKQDGTVFSNREGLLPSKPSGYYHEYTVETPGSSDRGARRIITGQGGEYYYTGDHYASFVMVDVTR